MTYDGMFVTLASWDEIIAKRFPSSPTAFLKVEPERGGGAGKIREQ